MSYQELQAAMGHNDGHMCHPCVEWRYLSIEGDGAGLALGTDALGPWGVSLTARLDLTADVLQCCKLPSVGGRGGDQGHRQSQSVRESKRERERESFVLVCGSRTGTLRALTCRRHPSACGCKRGMTCASPVGPSGSNSLHRKAEEEGEKIHKLLFVRDVLID